MWSDSHCHLDLLPPTPDDLVAQAQQLGVRRFLLPSAEVDHWPRVQAVARQGGHAYALGAHPWFLPGVDQAPELAAYLQQASADPQLVAIGETGLDGLRPNMALQQQWLLWHLQQAQRLSLPVIVHCVRAQHVLLPLLRSHAVKGVVHGFYGSVQQAQALVAEGWYLGIGGLLLAPRSKLLAVVAQVPLSSLLLETDAPSMKPAQLPGTFNRPSNLLTVAQALAAQLSMPIEDLSAQLEDNRQRLFPRWQAFASHDSP